MRIETQVAVKIHCVKQEQKVKSDVRNKEVSFSQFIMKISKIERAKKNKSRLLIYAKIDENKENIDEQSCPKEKAKTNK